jgi:hypothetical protein
MSPPPNNSQPPIRLFLRLMQSSVIAETPEPKEAHKSLQYNDLALSPWGGGTSARALTPPGAGSILVVP